MTQPRQQQQTNAGTAGTAPDGAPTFAEIMTMLGDIDDSVGALHDALMALDEAQQDADTGRRRRGSSSAASSGNGPSSPAPNGTDEANRRFGASR